MTAREEVSDWPVDKVFVKARSQLVCGVRGKDRQRCSQNFT